MKATLQVVKKKQIAFAKSIYYNIYPLINCLRRQTTQRNKKYFCLLLGNYLQFSIYAVLVKKIV